MSRQIKGLENELGAPLFVRGARHVEMTPSGQLLLRVVEAGLPRIDSAVRQIRQTRSRKRVSVTTFASFGSLWLLPRIEAFQREQPDIDIRVSAIDAITDMHDLDLDLDLDLDRALRYCSLAQAPGGAMRRLGELLTPVVSRSLAGQVRRKQAPPLAKPADLALHTLAEAEDTRTRTSTRTEYLSWRRRLKLHGQPTLQPQRWLCRNFTCQQVQAALAGHGVARARAARVFDALQRGELVEPFGAKGRTDRPCACWLVVAPASRTRPEVNQFCRWVLEHARPTRIAIGEDTGGA